MNSFTIYYVQKIFNQTFISNQNGSMLNTSSTGYINAMPHTTKQTKKHVIKSSYQTSNPNVRLLSAKKEDNQYIIATITI